jgi:hypothetical protein
MNYDIRLIYRMYLWSPHNNIIYEHMDLRPLNIQVNTIIIETNDDMDLSRIHDETRIGKVHHNYQNDVQKKR